MAQDETAGLPKNSIQTEQVPDVRIPPKEEIEKFIADKQFNYERKDRKPTLKEILMRYLNYFLKEASENVLGYVVIFIIVFVFVLLLIRLGGIKSLQSNIKNSSEANILTEDINEMNFNVLIQNALNNKDYRLCVRLMYLKSLKLLSDRKIINWNENKTNYSYLSEIKDVRLYDNFLELTILFDYVWYGNLKLDDNSFYQAQRQLNNFNDMMPNLEN